MENGESRFLRNAEVEVIIIITVPLLLLLLLLVLLLLLLLLCIYNLMYLVSKYSSFLRPLSPVYQLFFPAQQESYMYMVCLYVF